MIGPGMSSRAKQITALIAIVAGLLLPKHVECGYPGGECLRQGRSGRMCTTYELEPVGFYLIEWVVGRNVGFAYAKGQVCP